MAIEGLRRSLAAAPRDRLPEIAALLWRAYGAGEITEAEAGEISGLIEARKALGTSPGASEPRARHLRPPPVRCARRERQRRWAASGWLPPDAASRLTPARAAVLAVVMWQVAQSGSCRLCWRAIADLAGVSATTVKEAVRDGRRLGLIATRERRHRGRRSETTVVTVADRAVVRWIERRRGRPGGGGAGTPANQYQEEEKRVNAVHDVVREGIVREDRPVRGDRGSNEDGKLDRSGW